MRAVTHTVFALAFGVMLSACGGAEAPIVAQDAAYDIRTNYTVVPEDSTITVSALQQGERFEGRFERFDAEILFKPDDLDGSMVRVRIPLAGLDLGNADRNDAIPGKVWFNTRLHPVAIFESERIRAKGDAYVAQGELKMKGLRQPVSLPFTLEEANGMTTMRGRVELDRTKWNLGEAPWDTEDWVSHAVDVDIVVVAEPDPS